MVETLSGISVAWIFYVDGIQYTLLKIPPSGLWDDGATENINLQDYIFCILLTSICWEVVCGFLRVLFIHSFRYGFVHCVEWNKWLSTEQELTNLLFYCVTLKGILIDTIDTFN